MGWATIGPESSYLRFLCYPYFTRRFEQMRGFKTQRVNYFHSARLLLWIKRGEADKHHERIYLRHPLFVPTCKSKQIIKQATSKRGCWLSPKHWETPLWRLQKRWDKRAPNTVIRPGRLRITISIQPSVDYESAWVLFARKSAEERIKLMYYHLATKKLLKFQNQTSITRCPMILKRGHLLVG